MNQHLESKRPGTKLYQWELPFIFNRLMRLSGSHSVGKWMSRDSNSTIQVNVFCSQTWFILLFYDKQTQRTVVRSNL